MGEYDYMMALWSQFCPTWSEDETSETLYRKLRDMLPKHQRKQLLRLIDSTNAHREISGELRGRLSVGRRNCQRNHPQPVFFCRGGRGAGKQTRVEYTITKQRRTGKRACSPLFFCQEEDQWIFSMEIKRSSFRSIASQRF